MLRFGFYAVTNTLQETEILVGIIFLNFSLSAMMNLPKSDQELAWNLLRIINLVITQFYRIKTNWVIIQLYMYINYSHQLS